MWPWDTTSLENSGKGTTKYSIHWIDNPVFVCFAILNKCADNANKRVISKINNTIQHKHDSDN